MSREHGFAVWITGLPASGKSSAARALVKKLAGMGVSVIVLESDEMRRVLTPEPSYSPVERDIFYGQMAQLGELLVRQGMNVIIDATGNKRQYRDKCRSLIRRFIEAYVQCPLEICIERDPKGIYARAAKGGAATVPGLQSSYEPPTAPEITIDCRMPSEAGADAIISKLKELQFI